ncbi:VIT domain-containing protein [Baaleninema sp.]|uniref:VIT domain-containing protein n=1 Tax=Baaleninema sp. TaxID=3101197 RepID=UPI003D00BC07
MFSQSSAFSHLTATAASGKPVVFALKHTCVNARISGNLARVEVEQQFENPLSETLEAVYVFPLPADAAVDEMELQIGDRIVRGRIQKREDARNTYRDAQRRGRTASLLEQERENIFTYSIANIPPGESVRVRLQYSNCLKFDGGDYEFVLPTTIGPRFIPSSDDEDADRIVPPTVPAPDIDADLLEIHLEIEAGVPLQSVRSQSHRIQLEFEGDRLQVRLDGSDRIPNKDFILHYRVSGKTTRSAVLTHSDERGSHFAAYLIPALTYAETEILPKDIVFLIDTSGSQQGKPLDQCKALLRRFVTGLNPDDTFSLIDFNNSVGYLAADPLPNTAENRANALAYIDRLYAEGGTYLLNGVRAVLDFPEPDDGRLRSIVLLTDGYIGNEREVLTEVQRFLKPSHRLYSFGAGSSVNRFLLDRIAETGRGYSQVVRHDEPIDAVAQQFFDRVNSPVLTDIDVTWNGAGNPPTIYPNPLPDLFAAQPLVLFGHAENRGSGRLTISGRQADGTRYEETLSVEFTENNNPAIAQLWGRACLKALANQTFELTQQTLVKEMTQTALEYRLLSPYTAFVAVEEDRSQVVDVSGGVSAAVPLFLPDGMALDTSMSLGGRKCSPSSSPPSPRSTPRPVSPSRSLRSAKVSPGRSRKRYVAASRRHPASFTDDWVTDLRERGALGRSKSVVKLMVSSEATSLQTAMSNPGLEIEVGRIAGFELNTLEHHRTLAKLEQSLCALQYFPKLGTFRLIFGLIVRDGKVRTVVCRRSTVDYLFRSGDLQRLPEIKEVVEQVLLSWTLPPYFCGEISIELNFRA